MTVTTKPTEAEAQEIEGRDPLSPRAGFLEGVFRLARTHDKVCQQLHHEAYSYYHMGTSGTPDWVDDAAFNEYGTEVLTVCAIVAEAAMRRIPSDFAARLFAADDAFLSMDGSDLEQFLRPIFEESGIGHRFEVRRGHEVYDYGF